MLARGSGSHDLAPVEDGDPIRVLGLVKVKGDLRLPDQGLQSLVSIVPAAHTQTVCEAREGAGPYQPPGNRNRGGKAEKPNGQ